jgi:DNA-binding beta-propeller fold protein YncE
MLNNESKFYDNDDISSLDKSYLVLNGETGEVVRLGKPAELPFDVAQAKAEEEIYLMKNSSDNND